MKLLESQKGPKRVFKMRQRARQALYSSILLVFFLIWHHLNHFHCVFWLNGPLTPLHSPLTKFYKWNLIQLGLFFSENGLKFLKFIEIHQKRPNIRKSLPNQLPILLQRAQWTQTGHFGSFSRYP